MKTKNDSNGDAQARSSLALGSAAWLRAVADDREEMLHALGALDEEGERETKREILGMRDAATALDRLKEAEELLRSACAIADRKGAGTAWDRFLASAAKLGLNGITARTYRVLPDDLPNK